MNLFPSFAFNLPLLTRPSGLCSSLGHKLLCLSACRPFRVRCLVNPLQIPDRNLTSCKVSCRFFLLLRLVLDSPTLKNLIHFHFKVICFQDCLFLDSLPPELSLSRLSASATLFDDHTWRGKDCKKSGFCLFYILEPCRRARPFRAEFAHEKVK